jgi:hypothetical protein
MTGAEAPGNDATVATILGIAAACWTVAIWRMHGMDMGAATALGSFGSFVGLWVPMMAAMMLPGAVPAVLRGGRVGRVASFLGSYLALWSLVGVVLFALYRPHGTSVAGGVVLAAGFYELTPFKRRWRRRCREGVDSGFGFGAYCVGSSVGLMAMTAALGVMSVTWMGDHRRPRYRPEAGRRQAADRRSASARHPGIGAFDHRGPRVGSRTDEGDVRLTPAATAVSTLRACNQKEKEKI